MRNKGFEENFVRGLKTVAESVDGVRMCDLLKVIKPGNLWMKEVAVSFFSY